MRWTKVARLFSFVVAGASFYLTCMPVTRTGVLVYDGARIAFAVIVLGWLLYAVVKAWRQSFASERNLGRETTIYSVPRRLGLGTLFLIVFAFALLVTFLNRLGTHATLSLSLVAFVVIVGALQIAFDRAPRHASLVAGGVLVPAVVVCLWLAASPDLLSFGLRPGLQLNPFSDVMFHVACWSVGGGALGYLAGTVIGGVFLVANTFSKVATNMQGRRL